MVAVLQDPHGVPLATWNSRVCKAVAAALVWSAFALSNPVAHAHEGHDHGAPPTPVSTTIAPRVDASSTMFELIAVHRDDKLTVFIDRFETNEPVLDAVVEVDTPAGTIKAAANTDGTYTLPAPWAARGGSHDLIFTVTAGTDLDVLTGTLKLPGSEAVVDAVVQSSWLVASAVAKGVRERIAAYDPSLPAVALIAFVLGLFFARRRRGSVGGAAMMLAMFGVLLAPQPASADVKPASATAATSPVDLAQRFPDGSIFVPKASQRILGLRTIMAKPEEHRRAVSLPGRIIPDPSASGNVQAPLSGRLTPPPGGFPRLGQAVKTGDVLGYVVPSLSQAESSENRQRIIELEQQSAVVKQRLARFRAARDLVARQQIEEAEIELKAVESRRAALLTTRTNAEPLVAPVDGVIAQAAASPGQVAEPNALIFQVVDRERLWVEALTFDALAGAQNASARLSDGRSVQLDYRGTGFAERSQAIPIHFAINESTRGLRMGQLLTVIAETDEVRRGMAVPRTSVVRAGNGQPIVFEHTNAERFVPREVRVEALDGDRVIVVSGLEPNRRIVTQGVELLNQIR
jgi:cobalt-zinc-cadmium efflux system membrane fusion protein